MIKAGPTFPQLSVRGDLRITEGQDVEAKAVKCLREGAGAEEEGEFLLVAVILCFDVCVQLHLKMLILNRKS